MAFARSSVAPAWLELCGQGPSGSATLLGLDGNARADELFGNRNPEKDETGKQKAGEENSQPVKKQKWTASRLWVNETVISGPLEEDLIQTRVMIDRFTGGAHSGALFNEQPVFPLAEE